MADENFRQAIGEIAGQTFAGPLLQMKFEKKRVFALFHKFHADIVGPLGYIYKERFEKPVCPVIRKKIVQGFAGKLVAATCQCYKIGQPP